MGKGCLDSKKVYFTAWAYSFGGACGWGAFMMAHNIFLPEAGPLGSVIGVVLAAVFMYIIGYCTSYMAKRFPINAGVHVYIGEILGADHGFLSAWAILLAYLSILWANFTALVLLVHFVWGDVLQFGFHYKIVGYDVYFGEILVTVLAIVIVGCISLLGKKIVRPLNLVLAVSHIVLLLIVFVGVIVNGSISISDGFADTNTSAPLQVFNILMLAPWMFVGFEAFMYKYDTGERSKINIKKLMSTAVTTIAIAYIIPILIPILYLPEGCNTWQDYLALSSVSDGLMGLPVFYSTYLALGNAGLYTLIVCLLCSMSTSFFGMYRASACLMASMAKEDMLPRFISKKSKNNEPYIATLVVMFISILVPFVGRTAIGWIVDITTISANIVYVYSMCACFKLASKDGDINRRTKIAAVIGMVISVTSFLFLLVPNILSETKIASESYLILAVWCIIVMFYYWYVYSKDEQRIYGKSPTMWIFLSFLIFFSSIMWIRQRSVEKVLEIIDGQEKEYLTSFLDTNSTIEMILVLIVLTALFSLFSLLIKRQIEADKKTLAADMKNKAKTAFLFNMSHDIRTPMNAILGFTDLALLDTGDSEKMDDYLRKIKSSGNHLLSLINDILEMSRIESGKMELTTGTVDLIQIFSNVDSITRGLADAKGQTLEFNTDKLEHRYVYTDQLRLNQVLLNLVSNAIKYTQNEGNIKVSIVEQVKEGEKNQYTISVKDNGMGMSEEFAAKVFEAFERDERATKSEIQGTGLGMSITKRIVDKMGGNIYVKTELNKGSEFVIEVELPPATEDDISSLVEKNSITEVDFAGKRVLLTDDYEVNREIATAILEMMGFEVETAVNGKDALEHVLNNPADHYDIIFLDIQMPIMDGYETARAIRDLSDKAKASIPILAMTANAFEEDVRNAKNAGMNGHVAKPIDSEKLVEEIISALNR